MSEASTGERRFRVALTFPGQKRRRVAKLADCLAERFKKQRVLYDKYHEAELARRDLDLYLPNLYRTESDLVVVFLCPQYAEKKWCLLEWRAIRQFICGSESERIMFLSFGPPGDLTGLGIFQTDGYVDIQKYSPQYVADLIFARLDGLPAPSPPAPKVSTWVLVLTASLVVATGGAACMALRPSVFCEVLTEIGLRSPWCEGPIEAADIARLQGMESRQFALPPRLKGRGEAESQSWLIQNHSDRPVGVLIGKLAAGEPGSNGRPTAWEKIAIPADSQEEWSTGIEALDSSGVWALIVYDPVNPVKMIASPKPCRLLMTTTEVSQFKDIPALVLSINRGHAPPFLEISQNPLLPILE